MLQILVYNAKQSFFKRIKFRTQMCVVPNYDQKHIKYPNPTKKCRATGSKDILQH